MQGITESMTLKFLAVAFVCVFIEIAVSLWTRNKLTLSKTAFAISAFLQSDGCLSPFSLSTSWRA